MEIAILGANGFVGGNLVKGLEKYHHRVYSITKKNYQSFVGLRFDVLINANGNSKKYLANAEPLLDFDLSVKSVYNSLFDFEFGKYIYISSNDTFQNSVYGFHKGLAEDIIAKWCWSKHFQFFILKCGSIIGPGLKKGILYDIINHVPLTISSKSRLQFISTKEINNTILGVLNQKDYNMVLDVFSPQNIDISSIEKIVGKKARYVSGELPLQSYDLVVNNPFMDYKSSRYYIKEYVKKC